MGVIDELVRTIASASGYVMAAGVVGLFATMAVMLWSWRKVGLRDNDRS